MWRKEGDVKGIVLGYSVSASHGCHRGEQHYIFADNPNARNGRRSHCIYNWMNRQKLFLTLSGDSLCGLDVETPANWKALDVAALSSSTSLRAL